MAKAPANNPSPAPKMEEVQNKTCPNTHNVFQSASHVEFRYMVQIPPDDTLEDICKPSYWAHHAARVTPKALLTCIDKHLRWEADLRVLEAGRNFLRVAVIRHVEYKVKTVGDADLQKIKEKHTIESNGQNGWRVLDDQNNILVSGLATRDMAEQYLDTHLASMNRKVAA